MYLCGGLLYAHVLVEHDDFKLFLMLCTCTYIVYMCLHVFCSSVYMYTHVLYMCIYVTAHEVEYVHFLAVEKIWTEHKKPRYIVVLGEFVQS